MMEHPEIDSYVSYVYDGAGHKLYGNYKESRFKSSNPLERVMDRSGVLSDVVSRHSSATSTATSSATSASTSTSSTSSTGVRLSLTGRTAVEEGGRKVTTQTMQLYNSSRTDYCGNVVYEDSVCRLLFSEGYVTFNKNTGKAEPHYYLKDHLGNVRVEQNGGGVIEQASHYYAFGGLMGDSSGGDVQKYKYNGKELDRFLGWDMLDYGARWYDSKLQCWSTVDPLAEKYYHISPYVYCADNPVKYVDLRGDSISLDLQAINAIYNGLVMVFCMRVTIIKIMQIHTKDKRQIRIFIQRPQKNLDLLWKKELANIRERRNDYEIFI